MKITVDASSLKSEANRANLYKGFFEQISRDVIMKHAFKSVRRMKIAMPVDTGAARGRWGTPGAPGGVFRVSNDKLTIETGAELEPFEYIQRLNEGSSRQAPAGFIDDEANRLAMEIAEDLLKDIKRRMDLG